MVAVLRQAHLRALEFQFYRSTIMVHGGVGIASGNTLFQFYRSTIMVAFFATLQKCHPLFQFYRSTIMVSISPAPCSSSHISILQKYDYGKILRSCLTGKVVISILQKYDYGKGVRMSVLAYPAISILQKYDYGKRLGDPGELFVHFNSTEVRLWLTYRQGRTEHDRDFNSTEVRLWLERHTGYVPADKFQFYRSTIMVIEIKSNKIKLS